MKNYEDKIYSLGETVTGQTQAMSQAVQKTLENNGGVGIMTGYYDQNLSILSVSNLLLHSTGHTFATVYKGNIIKNLIMDCQSYTKYRPNETTGGIFVSWRRKEELPTGA